MYVSSSKACEYYGVAGPTLIRWATSNKIKFIRTPGGDYRYWLEDTTTPLSSEQDTRYQYIYARVSTYRQKEDLQRQISYLTQKFPKARLEQDIGSGLGFHRKGIQRLLELILMGKVSTVIITHKDRISRFSFELFEWLCKRNNTTIMVDHENITLSTPRDELTEDLLAITHSFSSRMYGNRKFSSKVPNKNKKQDNSNDESNTGNTLCVCEGDSIIFGCESTEIPV